MDRRDELAAAFDRQGDICTSFAAPFYGELCHRGATDIARGGAIATLLGDHVGDPATGSLPLRLLAALHARVLAGLTPSLGRHYPSIGGRPVWPAAWDAFLAELTAHGDEVRPWLAHPPQTNEVGRSSALLGGFLSIAAGAGAAGVPLHLLELGASAGLNLRWDRYGHRLGDCQWGDAASPVQLRPSWSGSPPPLAQIVIASRRGCDLRPIDVGDAAARARLFAFVWADHTERLATLRAAVQMAQRDELRVETADAAAWLDARLLPPLAAGATVVFHSSIWNYLSPVTQQHIEASIAAAGGRSSPRASLHWLRWEDPPGSLDHELRLCSWPGGIDRLLARGRPHGQSIAWLGAPAGPATA